MSASVFSFLSLTRRAVLLGGVMLLSSEFLRAAEEAAPVELKPIPFWGAGGRLHGPKVRKDNPMDGNMSFLSSRMWGFYETGQVSYYRPGKDKTPKGEEIFWIGDFKLVGKVGSRRLWQVEMKEEREDDEKAKGVPAIMLALDPPNSEGAEPEQLSLFFFLVGSKNDVLNCTFDAEKGAQGQLIVSQTPQGKGVAHSYEFHFKDESPVLVEAPRAGKVKRGK